MTIKRKALLDKLIAAKHNHFVKIITGIRRCGKSFLLFTAYSIPTTEKLNRKHFRSAIPEIPSKRS